MVYILFSNKNCILNNGICTCSEKLLRSPCFMKYAPSTAPVVPKLQQEPQID